MPGGILMTRANIWRKKLKFYNSEQNLKCNFKEKSPQTRKKMDSHLFPKRVGEQVQLMDWEINYDVLENPSEKLSK